MLPLNIEQVSIWRFFHILDVDSYSVQYNHAYVLLLQVLFLMYHYFNAKEIYNAIRVFIAAYVWMTGFGNFSYYYVRKDFSLARFAQVLLLINLFLHKYSCGSIENKLFPFMLFQSSYFPNGQCIIIFWSLLEGLHCSYQGWFFGSVLFLFMNKILP